MTESRLGRRLQRILLLLPYAIKHPGVSVDELSKKFGVGREELMSDLELVFMCGLPGYGPGDLIDVSFDDERVYVRMADYFGAPFRLTPAEALALYAGGQALAALPEMADADALRRALEKLRKALGMSEGEGPGVDVLLEEGVEDHLRTLNEALANERRVALEYLSASRGELTERTVSPWGLVAALGRWYLIGHDHLSDSERMFRVDRIKSAAVTEEAADLPDDFDPDRYQGAFLGESDAAVMTIEISPEVARWFEDYYPVRSSAELRDGWRRIEMVISGEPWAAVLLLRLGSGVRNVAPDSLTRAAEKLAREIASAYR